MTTDWQAIDDQYMMSTYRRLPLVISKAQGNYLFDEQGHAYLDVFTGLAVNILGHRHPALMEALYQQSESFLHVSNVFVNQPAVMLARLLIQHSMDGKVFYTNSGAEATEAAVKLIHKWSKTTQGQGRKGFVVLKNSFHGRTLGVLALTRQAGAYQDYPTALSHQDIYEVQANDLDELREVMAKHQPAVVLMEPVLGSGGILPLEEQYLQEVSRLCVKHGALCCMDEIQTGMGRTGKLFAYQHAHIEPDLILFAKGVGGGLPLGGFIAGAQLKHLFQPGDHGTTFAPSPLAAAMGRALMEQLFDQGMMEQGRTSAANLWRRLERLQEHVPYISEIRGKGMMIGIVLKASAEKAMEIQRNMLDDGILLDITQQTIIRLLPPLTLSDEDIALLTNKLQQHIVRVCSREATS